MHDAVASGPRRRRQPAAFAAAAGKAEEVDCLGRVREGGEGLRNVESERWEGGLVRKGVSKGVSKEGGW